MNKESVEIINRLRAILQDSWVNEFEIKSLQPCPKCGYQPIIRELPNGGYKIVCRVCDLTTGLFNHKQNLINYWNAKTCEEAVRYLQEDYETMFDREKE